MCIDVVVRHQCVVVVVNKALILFFKKKMLDIYKSFWICLSLFFSQHITTNYTCMQLCKLNNVMFYIITDQRLVLGASVNTRDMRREKQVNHWNSPKIK
jgi:hypothetical protein